MERLHASRLLMQPLHFTGAGMVQRYRLSVSGLGNVRGLVLPSQPVPLFHIRSNYKRLLQLSLAGAIAVVCSFHAILKSY